MDWNKIGAIGQIINCFLSSPPFIFTLIILYREFFQKKSITIRNMNGPVRIVALSNNQITPLDANQYLSISIRNHSNVIEYIHGISIRLLGEENWIVFTRPIFIQNSSIQPRNSINVNIPLNLLPENAINNIILIRVENGSGDIFYSRFWVNFMMALNNFEYKNVKFFFFNN